MKVEERLYIIGKLNAAVTKAESGTLEELGSILADIVRDKTFGNYAFDIWHNSEDVSDPILRQLRNLRINVYSIKVEKL